MKRLSMLFYEVSYYEKGGSLKSKHFERFNNTKKYVNHLHRLGVADEVQITKTFVYYAHHPRHKTWYVSYHPNQFLKVESY